MVDYLAARGVDRARLRARGFGETRPVADNSSKEGRAQNRRVVFTIVGDGAIHTREQGADDSTQER